MISYPFLNTSRYCFIAVILMVLIVLYGWNQDIVALKNGFQIGSSMKINTALGLGFLALAGFLESGRRKNILSKILIVIVLLGSFLTLIEYLFTINLGIDEFFMLDLASHSSRWHPGRPSPVTVLNFFLISFSIFGLNSSNPRLKKITHGILLIAWVISFQALLTHLEGVQTKYGLAVFLQMAAHTSLGFGLLCTGLLLTRPEEGVMRIVSGETEASRICRILLLSAIALSPMILWIQLNGEKVGIWDTEFGSILSIISHVVLFSWIAFRTGDSLLNSEYKVRVIHEKLEYAVQSRDEFLSIASHELRTPITAMKLRAQMMERALSKGNNQMIEPEKLQKFVEITNFGINRMGRLVDDMMDISIIQSEKFELRYEEVQILNFVSEIVDRYSSQLKEVGIQYEVKCPENQIFEIDRSRIDQVMTNLITNAIRYAPKSKMKIEVDCQGDYVKIIVQDGGAGIAKENHEKIFLRFSRLVSANEISGLGLGLFIVKKIILAHNGSIEVESEIGHGARFIIDLPIKRKPL